MRGVATSHSDGRGGATPVATPRPAMPLLLVSAKGFSKEYLPAHFAVFLEVRKQSSLGGAVL